jgi:hypothetical protein
MNRRNTLGELRWPTSPEFMSVAESFKVGCAGQILDFVWKAYDNVHETVLSKVRNDVALDDLERSITQYLEPEIHRAMDDDLPFYVQHGTYEHESRLPSPAQPPAYDIAFVLYGNRRIMWPVEAKVLRTDGEIADYVKDIQEQFLTGRYAPFSSSGAMIGYLLSGTPSRAFENISKKVPCTLVINPAFRERPHMMSDHVRNVPQGKNYPAKFRCHHLLLCLRQNSGAAGPQAA